MAVRKTGMDRIEDIEKKIQQLAKQKKEIEAKEKEKARKARTRRSIFAVNSLHWTRLSRFWQPIKMTAIEFKYHSPGL